jgi:hypothetical protein
MATAKSKLTASQKVQLDALNATQLYSKLAAGTYNWNSAVRAYAIQRYDSLNAQAQQAAAQQSTATQQAGHRWRLRRMRSTPDRKRLPQ